jgi:hypothetical protein
LRPRLEELRDRHAGQTFVVLGGGPSLAEEMRHAPAGLRISANEHGARWGRCHYIVALDNDPERVRGFGLPVIGQHPDVADYLFEPLAGLNLSGLQAVYVAYVLGAAQVVLAGMGLYQSRPGQPLPGAQPFAHQVALWERIRTTVPVGIRALGGPLTWLFGHADEGPAQPAAPPLPIVSSSAPEGVLVHVIREGSMLGRRYRFAASPVVLRPAEVEQAIAAGFVQRA